MVKLCRELPDESATLVFRLIYSFQSWNNARTRAEMTNAPCPRTKEHRNQNDEFGYLSFPSEHIVSVPSIRPRTRRRRLSAKGDALARVLVRRSLISLMCFSRVSWTSGRTNFHTCQMANAIRHRITNGNPYWSTRSRLVPIDTYFRFVVVAQIDSASSVQATKLFNHSGSSRKIRMPPLRSPALVRVRPDVESTSCR